MVFLLKNVLNHVIDNMSIKNDVFFTLGIIRTCDLMTSGTISQELYEK